MVPFQSGLSKGPKQTPGDPVYDGWLQTQIDHSDSAPYWEKRNSVWFGVGLKGSAGTPLGGVDLSIATMYNDFDANNSFQVAVTTDRRANLGGKVGINGCFHLFQLGRDVVHGFSWRRCVVGGVVGIAIIALWPLIGTAVGLCLLSACIA